MPKIRIDPRAISGDDYIIIGTNPRWVETNTGSNLWLIPSNLNYDYYYGRENTKLSKLTYCFSKNLSEYLPENSYLTKFNIYFYLLSGEIGENRNYDIYIADKVFETKNQNLSGWNKISISANNIPDLSKTEKISVLPDRRGYESHDFITDYIYAPGPLSGGDENPYPKYRMPEKYIYEFCSLTSSYPPYIEIEYSYNPPKAPDTLNPNEVTLNPRTPIKFTWNSKIEQKTFELQYRVNGSNWNVITKNASERFYNLPAGTIREPSGTVEWKVRVMEESGVYSEWTSATFTIGTVPQPVPRLSSPVGDYIKNGKPITFEWDFVKNTVEEQKAYEIEISLPNGTKTIKETSPNTSHTVDLKITDSIVVYWKMRVQNNFDDWSDWTERVSFQTIGIPPAPQIMSIDNSNRPTVKWNSREQEAFKLSVEDLKGNVVFETKDILGATTREYKIDKVIPNDKYLFKLSILNAYAIYSEITEYTHIIEPTPIEKPAITIYKSNYFVEITSDYLEGEVLRDGKVIGKLKDGKFRDYTGANYKTYSYQVRAFKDDVVGLSDKVGGVTEFGEFNTLATVDKLDDFFLIKYGLNESIKKVYSFEVQGAAISLEGKKYPFYEFDNHARASFNLSFYLENMNQVIKLQSLIEKKKEFLLRENRGTNRQGTIQGVNVEYDVLGYLVTCTLIITGEDYE